MRTFNILLLLLLTGVSFVSSAKTYHCKLNPSVDEFVFYDSDNEVVLEYAGGEFTYLGNHLIFSEKGRGMLLSCVSEELGVIHSCSYRKFTLPSGELYKSKRKLVGTSLKFTSNGTVHARSTYRVHRFFSWQPPRIDITVTVFDASADALPFILLSTLARIPSPESTELLLYQYAFLCLLLSTL
jgi:hypothetical protein